MPLPRFLAGLVLVLVTLTATACGGEDGGSGSPTTADAPTTEEGRGVDDGVAERIGQQVANSDAVPGVTPAMQICVGERFLEDYDEDEAWAVAERSDQDVEALTPDEEAVLVDALDRCIEGRAFAEAYLEAIHSELGRDEPPTQESVDCIADVADGRVGTIAQGMNSSDEPPVDFLAETDACIPQDVVDELLAAALAEPTDGGVQLTQDQVDCLVDRLSGTVTFGQLATQAPEASDAIRAALLQCPPA